MFLKWKYTAPANESNDNRNTGEPQDYSVLMEALGEVIHEYVQKKKETNEQEHNRDDSI